VERAALDRDQPFAHQGVAAVDEARRSGAVSQGDRRDVVRRRLVGLSQVGGVAVDLQPLAREPRHGAAGVQAAAERDADLGALGGKRTIDAAHGLLASGRTTSTARCAPANRRARRRRRAMAIVATRASALIDPSSNQPGAGASPRPPARQEQPPPPPPSPSVPPSIAAGEIVISETPNRGSSKSTATEPPAATLTVLSGTSGEGSIACCKAVSCSAEGLAGI